ncbi:MAG: hypothetical protein LBK08_03975 [Treponema sp.]|nr:hypothetical protein [Treponema sp.]
MLPKTMTRLTEDEYGTLEDEITRNPPDVDPARSRRPVRMVEVDQNRKNKLVDCYRSSHQGPALL